MTVHIVSVGISLRDFFEKGHLERTGQLVSSGEEVRDRWKKDKLGLAEGVYKVTDRLEESFGLGAGVEPPSHNSLASFRELAADVEAGKWAFVSGLSAELETVRAYNRNMVVDDDLTILLASDTEDGRACAIWTAIALAKGDVDRVLYLGGVGQETRLVRPEKGQILVLSVEGLDAQQSGEFERAMEVLGYVARLLVGNRGRGIDPLLKRQEKVFFHLSGGYRATVPYLIATAEWLLSLGHDAQAHVLPEEAEKSLQIPLRRLPVGMIARELAVFGEHTAPVVPEGALLEGYAYVRRPPGAKLTEFGQGMRILFEEYLESGR